MAHWRWKTTPCLSSKSLLFEWLKNTNEHQLIAGALFHYELEFIHPFADGNGRMGRLWQTLILGNWKSYFYFLPVESLIKERQQEYYATLSATDKAGDITGFVEFILTKLATKSQIYIPDKPNSNAQKYRLTDKGLTRLRKLNCSINE